EVLSALGLLARIVQMFVKSCWPLMLFAALVAATGPVCAQGTEAGRFLSVVGDVRVGRDGAPQRAAQRAAEFYDGESIVTAARARGFGGVTRREESAGVILPVRRAQSAFAALQGTTPPVLVAPPAALFGQRTPIPQVTPQTRLMLTPIDAPGRLERSAISPTIK